jgi:hypothetical protein
MVQSLQLTLRLLVLFTYIMLGQVEAFQLRFSVLAISQIQPTSKRIFCREPTCTGRNRNIVYANAQLPSDENRKNEVIYVDDENMNDLPDDILTELDSSQPSELAVLKDVRYEDQKLFQERKYCISLLVYSFFSWIVFVAVRNQYIYVCTCCINCILFRSEFDTRTRLVRKFDWIRRNRNVSKTIGFVTRYNRLKQ